MMKNLILDEDGNIEMILNGSGDGPNQVKRKVPDDYPEFWDWDNKQLKFFPNAAKLDAFHHAQIEDGFADAVRSQISVLPGQSRRYEIKFNEALSIIGGVSGSYPMLEAEALASGIELLDLAKGVKSAGEKWATVEASLEAARLAAKRAVTSAKTPDEKSSLAQVDWAAVIAEAGKGFTK